jgi:hypothetical protein
MPLATRGVFSTPERAEEDTEANDRDERSGTMRYEFERGGRTVASAVWEGPAQVTIEVADPADRPTFDRYFGEEVVYLDAGIDFGGGLDDAGLTTRRRDWTPWEFERHVRNLAQKIGATVRRVETGPVEERTAEAAAR